MGNCTPNRLESYSYFNVYNVDAKLFKHSKGQIHITNNHMILYQKDTSSEIRWQLNGIRRYGFYKDIFLFECGRRCPTGEGLFAFKCNKAKRLNDAVHKAVLNNTSDVINLQPSSTPAFATALSSEAAASATPTSVSSVPKRSTTNNEASALLSAAGGLDQAESAANKRQSTANSALIRQESNDDDPALHNENNNSNIKSNYYVNGSLVRLPTSISFVNTPNGAANTDRNYINMANDVDPAILHITNSFKNSSSVSNFNNNNHNKNSKMSKSTISSFDASYSNLPPKFSEILTKMKQKELNYVSAQVIASKKENDASNGKAVNSTDDSVSRPGSSTSDSAKLGEIVVDIQPSLEKHAVIKDAMVATSKMSKASVSSREASTSNIGRSSSKKSAKEESIQVEYTEIHPKKTEAIWSAKNANDKKHLEYVALSFNTSNDPAGASVSSSRTHSSHLGSAVQAPTLIITPSTS